MHGCDAFVFLPKIATHTYTHTPPRTEHNSKANIIVDVTDLNVARVVNRVAVDPTLQLPELDADADLKLLLDRLRIIARLGGRVCARYLPHRISPDIPPLEGGKSSIRIHFVFVLLSRGH